MKEVWNKAEDWRVKLYPADGQTKEELVFLSALCFYEDENEMNRPVEAYLQTNYPYLKETWEQEPFKKVQYNNRTGMSGVNLKGKLVRRGSVDAVQSYFWATGHAFPEFVLQAERKAKQQGMNLFVIVSNQVVVGLITSCQKSEYQA